LQSENEDTGDDKNIVSMSN